MEKPSQSAVERHLVRNQLAKKGRLKQALAKLRRKIADNPKDPRVKAWEARCKEYEISLKHCAEGTYHKANGKPFGATVGVTL